jgi:NADH-quinone oxidoreductase subunit D
MVQTREHISTEPFSEWQGTVEELKGLVSDKAMTGESMLLNMGPQHPSTHGVLRILLELEGEEIVTAIPDIGFLHTGIEKNMEAKTYEKSIVMTDRMDYLNPMGNGLVYNLAIEKIAQLDVPERAQIIRVILAELTRINSHLVWMGIGGLDLGVTSTMTYAFREREVLLDIFEMVSGQRMMSTYFRPGGLWRDVPDGFEDAVKHVLNTFPQKIKDYEALIIANPVFVDRTQGVGFMSAEDAMAYGLSGPSLRGSGVNYDIRKAAPYSGYENFDFDVPVGEHGDVFDRFILRIEEMRQSLRIIEQGLNKLKPGPFRSDNRKYVPPPRAELGRSMEAVIHHFKLWTEGFKPPVGEVYVAIEGPRGELGCYLVSDGSPNPWRVHFRDPSFVHIGALQKMGPGHFLADLVAIIGSIDIVLGGCDR